MLVVLGLKVVVGFDQNLQKNLTKNTFQKRLMYAHDIGGSRGKKLRAMSFEM
jgi:hypothetical protein